MSSRVLIYNRDLTTAAAEVQASVERSWVLNEYGKAQFTLATSEAACNREVLRFGNYVAIEHDRLPTWCGVLYPPRTWGKGQVQATAYSMEFVLKYRRGPTQRVLSGTAGSIFEQMLALANQTADTFIRAGEVYGGGKTRQETVNLTKLYDEIRRVAKRAGNDWNVTAEIDELGRLAFSGNWYEQAGTELDWALHEGVNLEFGDQPLNEQGEIINDFVGFGPGASWESKGSYRAFDSESMAEFGVWQSAGALEAATPANIQQGAESKVRQNAYPRNTYQCTALDVGDTFYNLRVGNVVGLRYFTVGFQPASGVGVEARVRVLGMAYSDARNTVELVVDEVSE